VTSSSYLYLVTLARAWSAISGLSGCCAVARFAQPAWIEDEHTANEEADGMNIEFLSTLAVIAPDPAASGKLYVDTLGLPLESHGDDYLHSEGIAGCKSFGVWPLSQAAQACFGTSQWPAERPVPQVSIEFDVADAAAVSPAARELEQAGYELLHAPREEPWGQTVARLQSPEGAIVGISYAPVLHDQR
jgi:catechol 2,3-dioxygenase-like lactoylglutathione lyase family enzyme